MPKELDFARFAFGMRDDGTWASSLPSSAGLCYATGAVQSAAFLPKTGNDAVDDTITVVSIQPLFFFKWLVVL